MSIDTSPEPTTEQRRALHTLWLNFAQIVAAIVLVLAATLAMDRFLPGLLPWPNGAQVTLNTLQTSGLRAPAQGTYAEAAERAQPAVVSIYTLQHTPQRGFFSPTRSPSSGLGSGVILSANGYILTNHHVIAQAEEIHVALSDGRSFQAALVGSDPDTDLAVLQVKTNTLSALTFAPEDSLKVGDIVLAIGNPFGVGQTVTLGIVSALQRKHLGLNTYENFIQTDAAINPGNSGGALIDADGNLVGINTAIYSRSGGSQGIGFAIPISIARKVMEEIIARGEVTRGWIGVEIADMTPEIADALGLNEANGVVITGVLRSSPAERAGVMPGDVILNVNSQIIHSADQLMAAISALLPGRGATLQVMRRNVRQQLNLRVEKRPRQETPGGE